MKLPPKPQIPDSQETIFWLKFQSQIIEKLQSHEYIFPDQKNNKNFDPKKGKKKQPKSS